MPDRGSSAAEQSGVRWSVGLGTDVGTKSYVAGELANPNLRAVEVRSIFLSVNIREGRTERVRIASHPITLSIVYAFVCPLSDGEVRRERTVSRQREASHISIPLRDKHTL